MALLASIASAPLHNTERNELFLLQVVEQISSNSLSCLIRSLMLKRKMGPGSVFHLHIYSGIDYLLCRKHSFSIQICSHPLVGQIMCLIKTTEIRMVSSWLL